ncbi:hypothetical protein F5Y18DRAFT_420271 [Xylariaceae sp. FL1019]|nr:hypothetical protein F5Y18DRAFT_420271 [Xylariaceae sp. FL1019]
MLPPTSLQLKALSAISATLRRPVLLRAAAPYHLRASTTHPYTNRRLFSTSDSYAATKAHIAHAAALQIPDFRTSAIKEIAPDDLFKSFSLISAPDKPVEDGLRTLFTTNPASFSYAQSDFYKLRKNTRMPEVCILGRSNVGKSSLVNAVADRVQNGLAKVSSKAGKTKSINMYGFGPAPTLKELAGQAAEYKGKEDIPSHTFQLVDLPGYGHRSMKEWGKHISLYLSKRDALKGAVLLIDAEVGPKQGDLDALDLLSEFQVKTAIILTKADKVKGGVNGLQDTCKKVWDALHNVEQKIKEGNWTWEKDVFVTASGAKDAVIRKSTATTARLAVAQLAGLTQDNRPKVARDQRWTGKMISFDDLQWAPTGAAEPATATSKAPAPAVQSADVSEPATKAAKTSEPNSSKLESARGAARQQSAMKNMSNIRTLANHNPAFGALPGNAQRALRAKRPSLGRRTFSTSSRAQSRAAHVPKESTSTPELKQPSPHTGEELDMVVDNFCDTLTTDTPRDELRRLFEMRSARDQSWRKPITRAQERRRERFFKRFPITKTKILEARMEENLARNKRKGAEARTSEEEKDTWSRVETTELRRKMSSNVESG